MTENITQSDLDCRGCGLCCRGREGTVLVSPEDIVRWKRYARVDLVQSLVPGHFSLPGLASAGDGRCVHQGTDESSVDCSIYELRPQACRDFEKGSAECLTARRRGGRD